MENIWQFLSWLTNHLEGHALTIKLTENIDYPYLLLLISGGHCQTIIIEKLGKYHIIGTTLDDAVGEADQLGRLILAQPIIIVSNQE